MIQGEFPIGTSGKDPARQQEKIGKTFQRTEIHYCPPERLSEF